LNLRILMPHVPAPAERASLYNTTSPGLSKGEEEQPIHPHPGPPHNCTEDAESLIVRRFTTSDSS
jgi:hypothetical protein